MISPLEIKFARVFGAIDSPLGSKLYPKKLIIYPPILAPKNFLQISLTNSVVCPTYTHYSRWFGILKFIVTKGGGLHVSEI